MSQDTLLATFSLFCRGSGTRENVNSSGRRERQPLGTVQRKQPGGRSLPRYFFQTSDRKFPPDDTGVELGSPCEAREEAVKTAGEIVHDLDGALWRAGEWRMHVTDEQGRTVCLLTFKAERGEL
jgi:hypothetical protein